MRYQEYFSTSSEWYPPGSRWCIKKHYLPKTEFSYSSYTTIYVYNVLTHSIRLPRESVLEKKQKDLRLSSLLLVKKGAFSHHKHTQAATHARTYYILYMCMYKHTRIPPPPQTHARAHTHRKQLSENSLSGNIAPKKKRTERRRTKITPFSMYSSSVSEAKWWLRSIFVNNRVQCSDLDSASSFGQVYKRAHGETEASLKGAYLQKGRVQAVSELLQVSLSHTVDLQVGFKVLKPAGATIP